MFDRDQRAEIRELCHDELRLTHRLNALRGSYRYLCMVAGHPVFCHEPRGNVLRDFSNEPRL